MFDKINEQLEASMKPVTELAALNMTTFKDLAEKQSALYSSLISGSVSFAETASQQKDALSLVEAQKAYFQSLQESLTGSAKETYELVNAAQQKAGSLLKSASEKATAQFTVAS